MSCTVSKKRKTHDERSRKIVYIVGLMIGTKLFRKPCHCFLSLKVKNYRKLA